ncbi:hypothetical protein K458DRAFT_490488 [Lentithecium fluviatile CBS 122367]|uniref:F-box domain-containing protein n=1 Tax=Lentithecium fluviatile CBS 122367 TaxID=1168545 RepID=A0A6G1IN17_9PLEO|nr:hypothetical protein K458DRAFT_490488 [Lentithecium fluviatile CBS 122367]
MSAQKPQQSPLLALPSELIDEILSNFVIQRDFDADWRVKILEEEREAHNKRQIATLHALCLVCKDMHRHAEPALYSSLSVQAMGYRDTPHLCAFVFKLAASPHIAQCVRYIEHFSRVYDEDDLLQERTVSFRAFNHPAMRTGVETVAEQTLGPENFARWKELFELNINTALAALAIELSPNIQHLALPSLVRLPRAIGDTSCIFGPTTPPQNHFSKLQVLCLGFTFEHVVEGRGPPSTFMRSLEALHNLRYLKLICNAFALDPSSGIDTFTFPALRTLKLNSFGDSVETLANTITGCQDLEWLECTFYPSDRTPGGNTLSADLTSVQHALATHASTLTHLDLRLDQERHRGVSVPLANLADFPRLRTLYIDTVTLLGAPWSPNARRAESTWWYEERPAFRLRERLPPNIEELHLYNYHYFGDKVLVFLDLSADCGELPRLKTVFLYNTWHGGEAWPVVTSLLAEKGVRLV